MSENKSYDPQTLRKLQLTELEILRDFIEVCDRHEIPYFLSGGSAIGALRHGGFIPWDDDLDVCIPREEYERFIQIAEQELTDRYEILCADRTPNYPALNTQISKKGTKFRPMCFKNVKCDLGIYLDIFPYDHTVSDPVLRKKQIRSAWIWGKLYILRMIPFPMLPFKGIKGKIVKFVCACTHYGMVLCRISKKWLYRKYRETCFRYNDQDTGWYIDFQYTFPEKMLLSKEDIFPLHPVEFEGVSAYIIHEYHRYLTGQYGDYMQLPPVESRRNHFPYELDFGDEK